MYWFNVGFMDAKNIHFPWTNALQLGRKNPRFETIGSVSNHAHEYVRHHLHQIVSCYKQQDGINLDVYVGGLPMCCYADRAGEEVKSASWKQPFPPTAGNNHTIICHRLCLNSTIESWNSGRSSQSPNLLCTRLYLRDRECFKGCTHSWGTWSMHSRRLEWRTRALRENCMSLNTWLGSPTVICPCAQTCAKVWETVEQQITAVINQRRFGGAPFISTRRSRACAPVN